MQASPSAAGAQNDRAPACSSPCKPAAESHVNSALACNLPKVVQQCHAGRRVDTWSQLRGDAELSSTLMLGLEALTEHNKVVVTNLTR